MKRKDIIINRIKNDESINSIAESMNISPHTVSAVLYRYKVSLKKIKKTRGDRIRKMIAKGRTDKHIAKVMMIKPKSVAMFRYRESLK